MQEAIQAAPRNDIALLPPHERAVIILDSSKAEANLKELVAQSAGIVAVIDPVGREQAHRAAMNLRNARTAITKAGKAARDDANAFCTAVIAEEKRLVGISETEEKRVMGLRDGYDAEQVRIKQEQERVERERVHGIRVRIDSITNLPHVSFRDDSVQLRATLDDLRAMDVTEADFAEFCAQATEAKTKAIRAMEELLTMAEAAEAETARISAERAELERLRAEAAERERVAADAKRKMEEQQAAIAAERKALEDERAKMAAEKLASELAASNQAEHDKAMASAVTTGTGTILTTDGVAKAVDLLDEAVVGLPAATDEEVAGVANYHQGQVILPAPPTLRLGHISDRLNFGVTADFLLSLGFAPAATEKAAKLYHERDFAHICRALIRHIEGKIPAAEAA